MMRRTVGYLVRGAMLLVCMSVPAYLVLAQFAHFEPYLFPLRYLKAEAVAVTEHVTVGPYPGAAELVALRRSGVTTIVSLLDPAVVYERSLIEREEAQARSAGLRFVSLPMHRGDAFGSAVNRPSEKRLGQLLAAGPLESLYVHGFLDAPREEVEQALGLARARPPG